MKKQLIFVAALLAVFAIAGYAWTTITIYSGQTCYTTGADTYDTSNTYNLKYADEVEVKMYLPNVDTTVVTTYVDGWLAGQWRQMWYYAHTIDKGGASDSTWTSNFDNAWGFVLRGDTTNHIPGAEKIRFRNKIADMASSTTYTTTGPYYNMEMILRK